MQQAVKVGTFNRYVFLALCTAVTLLSLVPGSDSVSLGYSDKVAHFGMYAVLTGVALDPRPVFRTVMRSVVFVVLYGGVMELAQLLVPFRDSSWFDFGANTLGVISVWLLVHVGIVRSEVVRSTA